MKKNVVKAIIKEKQQEISQLKLIRRPISYEDNMCYVNVGIRRAGKSYLLYQDIQERVAVCERQDQFATADQYVCPDG